jgi:soluble lytic murein transglycosylase-like protein
MSRKTAIPTGLLLLLAATPAFAGDIVPVKQNGRVIYVNNEEPAQPPATTVLVYWSNVEKRWKRVPRKLQTASALRAARSAAAEVNSFVAKTPAAEPQDESKQAPQADPNYAGIMRGHSVTSEQLDKVIEQAAARHNVDANLVRAIVKVESNFNPRAVSHKGAMGLMQLMPGTARDLKVTQPFDPAQNVEGGVRHLKSLLETFDGNVELSLAAYNAGARAVQRNRGVPPYTETRNYVKKITNLYGNGSGNGSGYTAPIKVSRNANGNLTFTNTD